MRAASARGLLACMAVAVLYAGCNICGPEKRSVLTYADNGFTVSRAGAAPVATTLNGSLYNQQTDARAFQSIWDVFARRR